MKTNIVCLSSIMFLLVISYTEINITYLSFFPFFTDCLQMTHLCFLFYHWLCLNKKREMVIDKSLFSDIFLHLFFFSISIDFVH